MSPTKEELQQSVKDFAVSLANAIGTDETYIFLKRVTQFAETCPETIVELKVLVEENPAMFNNLLTKEGVEEARGLIETVSNAAPMFDFLK